MAQLRASDLRGALQFVGELNEAPPDETFPEELLGRLPRIVASEGAAFNERDLVASVVIEESGWCAFEPDPGGPDTGSAWSWEFVRHHPVNVYRRRTGYVGALANSDIWSRSARLRYEVFAPEYHAYWGLVDVVGIRLTHSATQTATIFVESLERDFTARDKAVLDAVRPHLAARHRTARVQRLLADALASLDDAPDSGEAPAIVLVGARDHIEFGSPAGVRLLGQYFGGSTTRLPQPLAEWLRDDRSVPFVRRRGERQLVVEAVRGRRSPLLLREEGVLSRPLTAREWDVMRSVEAGMTNDEIADLLCVTPATVKKHLEHVFDKLGVRNRTAALAQLRPWLSHGEASASQAASRSTTATS